MKEMSEPYVPPTVVYKGRTYVADTGAANLYQVGIDYLRMVVETQHDRFPEDFVVAVDTHDIDRMGASFMFTPEGIAMLAMVLNSPLAKNGAVNMIRAFIYFDRIDAMANGRGLPPTQKKSRRIIH